MPTNLVLAERIVMAAVALLVSAQCVKAAKKTWNLPAEDDILSADEWWDPFFRRYRFVVQCLWSAWWVVLAACLLISPFYFLPGLFGFLIWMIVGLPITVIWRRSQSRQAKAG